MSRRAQPNDDQPDEWIWGNTRGGGGAPLKTLNGQPIANLRAVVRGGVEVDVESPSKRRNKGFDNTSSRSYERDDDRSYDRDRDSDRRNKRNDRDRDDDRRRGSYDREDDDRGSAPVTIKGLESHYNDKTPPAKGFRNIHVDDSEREERIR